MNIEEFKNFVISEAKKIIAEEKSFELSEDHKPKAIKHKAKVPKVKKEPKPPEEKKEKKDKTVETKKKAKTPKAPKTKKVDEGITPEEITFLTEEIKKINKKLDFRNPLMPSVLSESQTKRMKDLYNYKVISDDDI